jgi:hypothetical protein
MPSGHHKSKATPSLLEVEHADADKFFADPRLKAILKDGP